VAPDPAPPLCPRCKLRPRLKHAVDHGYGQWYSYCAECKKIMMAVYYKNTNQSDATLTKLADQYRPAPKEKR
jgi:hypothetical protein